MTRLVKKEESQPMEIKVGDESKYICMCGLAKNQPMCDGTHKKITNEEEGKTYLYNDDGNKKEIQI